MPSQTDFSPQYFDEMAALELRHPWTRSMRALMFSLIRSSAPSRSPRVLDIGCGTGQFLSEIEASMPGALTFGMDLHAEAIAYARGRSVAQWILGSAADLPFPAGCFDIVHSSDVLQHLSLEQTERTCERCRDVLRPGGLLALRVRGETILSRSQRRDFSHAFSRRSLRLALESRKFQVLFLSHANALPSLWAEVQDRLRRSGASGCGQTVQGISLGPERSARNGFLAGYLLLERSWLLRTRIALPIGHTIICLARRNT